MQTTIIIIQLIIIIYLIYVIDKSIVPATKDDGEDVIVKSTPKLKHGKVRSKKQEIIDSINYIKSKKRKSKQDKESLYSLEMVLKNM